MFTKAKVSFGGLHFLLLLLPFNNKLLLFATLYNIISKGHRAFRPTASKFFS